MVNGPLGGNMGTPPAPAQPPQVNFTTTAESRGGFNNFLKSIPNTTNMTPIPPMGSSPMPPMGGNPMNNIDIFNQPMGMMGMNQPQMNPMMQQPMQPPMMGGLMDTPVQNFYNGGGVDDFGDAGISFDTSDPSIGSESSFNEEDFQDALDNLNTGSDSSSDDSMFSNDPQISAGINVGLDKSGGFTSGVIPGPKDSRFSAFRSVPFAQRAIGRDFATKVNRNVLNEAGDNALTVSDYFNTYNPSDDNKDRIAEFKSATGKGPNDMLSINDMNNIMDIQGKYEAGIRNTPAGNIEKIASTVNMNDDKQIANILDNLDLSLDKPGIDGFEMVNRYQNTGLPGAINLPTVGSTRNTVAQDQANAIMNDMRNLAAPSTKKNQEIANIENALQQNVLADRGRALGPTTFSDDLDGFRGNINKADMADIIDGNIGVDPSIQAQINAQSELDQAPSSNRLGFASSIDPRDETFENMVESGDRGITEVIDTSPPPIDFEEKVGRDFNAKRMADIERLYGEDVGQTKAGRGTDPTFLEGLGVPTPLTVFGDAIERGSRERMANEIAMGRPMGLGETLFGYNAPNLETQTMQDYMSNVEPNYDFGDFNQTSKSIPENRFIRNDSGRVIGIRDASGRVVSGRDPNAPIDTGDDNDSNPLILRPIPKAKEKEEEEDEDDTPNVFGGATPAPVSSGSVVVDSPFTSNVKDFSPTGFDSGDLNALIARLTGIPAPKSMAKGGVARYAEGGRVMQALDNLLATG